MSEFQNSNIPSKLKIGVFDSGVGGLTLVREVFRHSSLPIELDYIADDAYSPYGHLTPEEILRRSEYLVSLLMERGSDIIVFACNTATAFAIDAMRLKYPGFAFVGIEPYLNAFAREPVLLGGQVSLGESVVITTLATSQSQRFKALRHKLDPNNLIDHYVCRDLATLIEQAFYRGVDQEWRERLNRELYFLRGKKYKHIILGCTHYAFIGRYFEEEFGLSPISPCMHVAKRVFDLLDLDRFRSVSKQDFQNVLWFESTACKRREQFLLSELNLDLLDESDKSIICKLRKGVRLWQK